MGPIGITFYKATSLGIISLPRLAELELKGTKKGLDYIQNLLSKSNTFDINPLLICKLHEVSFGWIFPGWTGKYRTFRVTFSKKKAPPFYKIPELMTKLCSDLNERLNHLPRFDSEKYIIEITKLLACFHHKFVFIHPFFDYNGVIGRMLNVLIVLKLGLPPIEIKANRSPDRDYYLLALHEADWGDFSKLENIISNAIVEAFEGETGREIIF